MNHLAQIWQNTWNDVGGAAPKGWLAQVLDAWDEPHRHYHNRRHLEECLAAFQPVRSQCRHPGEVALALWFHDAVYNTHSNTNEADSADLAERAMFEAGLTGPVVGRVRHLILSSAHANTLATGDEAVMRDVDVLVLGADAERYSQYQQGVREEFSWVPEPVFKEGRSRVLQSFLGKPRIYLLPEFYDRYELSARRNLQRELKVLNKGNGKGWLANFMKSFS